MILRTTLLLVTITNVWMKKNPCFCGQKRNYVETNIIGGDFAEKNEFPWAALINLTYTELGHSYRCGGSLINDRFVVTAAHCLKQYSLDGDIEHVYDDITVILGEHDLSDETESRTFVSKAVPREVRAHPHFFIRTGQGKVKFDIGLLMLETPVDFDKYPHIGPICLPEAEDETLELAGLDKTGITVGWGITKVLRYESTQCDYVKGMYNISALSHKLKKINLKFEEQAECSQLFEDVSSRACPAPRVDNTVNLCATSLTGDVCKGDSGGGLVTLDSDLRNYILVGVSSQNLGCNSSSVWGDKLPSVFTNVREPSVINWIREYAVSDLVIIRRSQVEGTSLKVCSGGEKDTSWTFNIALTLLLLQPCL